MADELGLLLTRGTALVAGKHRTGARTHPRKQRYWGPQRPSIHTVHEGVEEGWEVWTKPRGSNGLEFTKDESLARQRGETIREAGRTGQRDFETWKAHEAKFQHLQVQKQRRNEGPESVILMVQNLALSTRSEEKCS